MYCCDNCGGTWLADEELLAVRIRGLRHMDRSRHRLETAAAALVYVAAGLASLAGTLQLVFTVAGDPHRIETLLPTWTVTVIAVLICSGFCSIRAAKPVDPDDALPVGLDLVGGLDALPAFVLVTSDRQAADLVHSRLADLTDAERDIVAVLRDDGYDGTVGELIDAARALA